MVIIGIVLNVLIKYWHEFFRMSISDKKKKPSHKSNGLLKFSKEHLFERTGSEIK